MSIRAMSHIWDHSERSGSELLMLLAIADHANDDGVCWPSVARLAARCRVSRRQAITIIRTLETAGDITVQRGGGRYRAKVYKCSLYVLTAKNTGKPNSAAECTVPPTTVQPEGDNGAVQPGNGAVAPAPNSPILPPKESKPAQPDMRVARGKDKTNPSTTDETSSWDKRAVAPAWEGHVRFGAVLDTAVLTPDEQTAIAADVQAIIDAHPRSHFLRMSTLTTTGVTEVFVEALQQGHAWGEAREAARRYCQRLVPDVPRAA